jgi:hypothetical protein
MIALLRRAGALACVFTVVSCDVNPYDASQRPAVTVTVGGAEAPVRIGWQPAGAQVVRVYTGTEDTGALVWSVSATGANTLVSGLAYGEASPAGGATDVPAQPLTAGATYTVEVIRRDPKGSGDGFTNTSNRYVGTARFTAP